MQNENRSQPRIRAKVGIEVFHPASGRAQRASVEELSWGGALIWCDEPPGEPGEELEVRLPYKPGHPIAITSEILRVGGGDQGQHAVAVRFTSLSTEDEGNLEKVLNLLLAGPGGGRREYPRLAQRLEVYFDDPADIRATLEDISRGGLSVTVPYSFTVNQSVQLTIFGPSGFRDLSLRARVVRQMPLEEEKVPLFNIGLVFEHPTRELQDMVQRLLDRMTSRQSLAARDWKKE